MYVQNRAWDLGRKLGIMASAGLTGIPALGHIHGGLIRCKMASGKSEITLLSGMCLFNKGKRPSLDLPVQMEIQHETGHGRYYKLQTDRPDRVNVIVAVGWYIEGRFSQYASGGDAHRRPLEQGQEFLLRS
ncbi:hypothetical protein O1611_g2029 [Lasiodiplodia mahajangana]|uniref:Uncharacterized protein n=1 Tax=Lasiodiplodia mahajangana TaxID=1108764 RepID=A0ACC2JVV4_9PEZI|nr:hypothetical protein O1611_g2029 [Lasiodiplodia mahajangana]